MMLSTGSTQARQQTETPIKWSVAAQLKTANGQLSPGFAGAVSGVQNDVFLLAGGANFPDKMPWEGGKKHYSDQAFVFTQKGNSLVQLPGAFNLPEAIAYGGSTPTPAGIVYAGGENEAGLSKKSWLLNWNPAAQSLAAERLPDLPLALTNTTLSCIGNTVYAAGGDGMLVSSAAFLYLDLQAAHRQWLPLPDLPAALANAVLLPIEDKGRQGLLLVGGRSKMLSGISRLHGACYFFDLAGRTWQPRAALHDGQSHINFSAGSGVALGPGRILLTGGDNGGVFHQIESYLARINAATAPVEKELLTREKNKLVINHQGFYRGLLLYDAGTDRWTKVGELPFPAQVTTAARLFNGNIILPSGEIKPGVRTPDIHLGKIEDL